MGHSMLKHMLRSEKINEMGGGSIQGRLMDMIKPLKALGRLQRQASGNARQL